MLPNEDRAWPTADGARLAYQTLVDSIAHEGTWFWSRWHYFLLANSILFVAVGQLLLRTAPGVPEAATAPVCSGGLGPAAAIPDPTHRAVVVAALAMAGMLLCFFWWTASAHADAFHRMRVLQARDLERFLGFGGYGPLEEGARITNNVRNRGHHVFDSGAVIRLFSARTRYSCPLRQLRTSTVTTKLVPGVFWLTWLAIATCSLWGFPGAAIPLLLALGWAWVCRARIVTCLRCAIDHPMQGRE